MNETTHGGEATEDTATTPVTRRDADGRWTSAIPLLLLAMLGMILLHACMSR
ncbi:MAG: hypothetical protein MUD07_10755 [Burkholderiaceae bacterium]|nr:hypothetical protein [Burkholderiaceae bacterium]